MSGTSRESGGMSNPFSFKTRLKRLLLVLITLAALHYVQRCHFSLANPPEKALRAGANHDQ